MPELSRLIKNSIASGASIFDVLSQIAALLQQVALDPHAFPNLSEWLSVFSSIHAFSVLLFDTPMEGRVISSRWTVPRLFRDFVSVVVLPLKLPNDVALDYYNKLRQLEATDSLVSLASLQWHCNYLNQNVPLPPLDEYRSSHYSAISRFLEKYILNHILLVNTSEGHQPGEGVMETLLAAVVDRASPQFQLSPLPKLKHHLTSLNMQALHLSFSARSSILKQIIEALCRKPSQQQSIEGDDFVQKTTTATSWNTANWLNSWEHHYFAARFAEYVAPDAQELPGCLDSPIAVLYTETLEDLLLHQLDAPYAQHFKRLKRFRKALLEQPQASPKNIRTKPLTRYTPDRFEAELNRVAGPLLALASDANTLSALKNERPLAYLDFVAGVKVILQLYARNINRLVELNELMRSGTGDATLDGPIREAHYQFNQRLVELQQFAPDIHNRFAVVAPPDVPPQPLNFNPVALYLMRQIHHFHGLKAVPELLHPQHKPPTCWMENTRVPIATENARASNMPLVDSATVHLGVTYTQIKSALEEASLVGQCDRLKQLLAEPSQSEGARRRIWLLAITQVVRRKN